MYCILFAVLYSLADHLKHIPTGQVTEIIEMFHAHLQDNLPQGTCSDGMYALQCDIHVIYMYLCIGLPRKKKRKLENKNMMLYQTIDLFSVVLDHVSLVGVDVAKLIHQLLYHDTVLPLLTPLPSLVNIIGY